MKAARHRSHKSFLHAVLTLTALAGLIGSVTYAALQSQDAQLTGNEIQTATANLQISTDGITFSNSAPGFAFGNLVPGGQAVPQNGYPLYLKNAGGTALALTLAVSSTPQNPDNVDLTKVHVILTPTSGGPAMSFPLATLISSASTGGTPVTVPSTLGNGGFIQSYNLQVSMDKDAISGPSADISNLVFSFGGTAIN